MPRSTLANSGAAAGSVMLAWSPSISTNVVGYNVYYGVASGVYTNTVSVAGPASTNATITGLAQGATYYFAATAVDALGNQSPYSNETSYSVPASSVSNTPPTLNPLPDVAINENDGQQTVSLTGITSGATNEVQTLTVTAASSNPGLIPNPTVNYTSPNSTGTLSFAPVTNSYGTAIITVTVNDGGASNNTVAQSFTVTVNYVSQKLVGPVPAIQVPPNTQTVEIGSVATLNTRVKSSSTPTYCWYFNGNPVTGSNTNRLCLPGVQPANIGTYTMVVWNSGGAVTSAPAVLNVIPPVPRRPVPAVALTAKSGTTIGLDCSDAAGSVANWTNLATITMTNSSQFYFDVPNPLPSQRFYRVWKSAKAGATPALNLNFVPAISLTGTVGNTLRLDYINAVGPTNAWVTLTTVTLTNASQLYFDTSVISQPGRLYRIVPVP